MYLQRIFIWISAFLLAARIKVYKEERKHCRTQSDHDGFNHLLTTTFDASVRTTQLLEHHSMSHVSPPMTTDPIFKKPVFQVIQDAEVNFQEFQEKFSQTTYLRCIAKQKILLSFISIFSLKN